MKTSRFDDGQTVFVPSAEWKVSTIGILPPPSKKIISGIFSTPHTYMDHNMELVDKSAQCICPQRLAYTFCHCKYLTSSGTCSGIVERFQAFP